MFYFFIFACIIGAVSNSFVSSVIAIFCQHAFVLDIFVFYLYGEAWPVIKTLLQKCGALSGSLSYKSLVFRGTTVLECPVRVITNIIIFTSHLSSCCTVWSPFAVWTRLLCPGTYQDSKMHEESAFLHWNE